MVVCNINYFRLQVKSFNRKSKGEVEADNIYIRRVGHIDVVIVRVRESLYDALPSVFHDVSLSIPIISLFFTQGMLWSRCYSSMHYFNLLFNVT